MEIDTVENIAKKSKRGGYRPGASRKGVPNKATTAAREVVAKFVDGNLDRLQAWLDQIAEGVWDEAEGKWVVPPDPLKAFQMVTTLLEYHIPKLQRVDMSVTGEVTVKTFNIKKVSSDDGQPKNAPIYGKEAM